MGGEEEEEEGEGEEGEGETVAARLINDASESFSPQREYYIDSNI